MTGLQLPFKKRVLGLVITLTAPLVRVAGVIEGGGVVLLDEHTVLVSNWVKFELDAGELKRADPSTDEISVVRRRLSGPADFAVRGNGEYTPPNVMEPLSLSTISSSKFTAAAL